jgi:hypothetical protein
MWFLEVVFAVDNPFEGNLLVLFWDFLSEDRPETARTPYPGGRPWGTPKRTNSTKKMQGREFGPKSNAVTIYIVNTYGTNMHRTVSGKGTWKAPGRF